MALPPVVLPPVSSSASTLRTASSTAIPSLLDEPTASLDPANREVVIGLFRRAEADGAGVLGIFHAPDVRARLDDAVVEVDGLRTAA